MADIAIHDERAPVQRDCHHYTTRRCGHAVDSPEHNAGTIAWWEHAVAWTAYARRAGSDQTAERIAQRGGFGYAKVTALLGHAPTTWRKVGVT